ncbi:MAG: PAS domain S-box protein [Dehalococcoidia bacterium]
MENNYKILVENAVDGIYTTSIESGKMNSLNPALASMFGYNVDEMDGMSILDLCLPEERPRLSDFLGRLDQGEPALDTFWMRKQDGSTLGVEMKARLIDMGSQRLVMSIARDVTERMLAEEALRKSEERFRNLFEHSNDAILIVDPARDQILSVNARACGMLGYSQEELLAQLFSQIHAKELDKLQEFMRSVSQEGQGWTDEISCIAKSKESIPAEISASTVDIDGRPCAICSIRDISQRRRNEAEIAAIDEVSRIVTSTLDIDEIYEQFAWEVKKLVDFDRMAINLLDKEAQSYTIKHVVGTEVTGRRIGDVVPLAGSSIAEVISSGKTLVRQDVAAELGALEVERYLKVALRSHINAPLISQGQVFGTIGLRSHQVGAYGPREQVILERLARQIASAVENAQLYTVLKRAEEQARRSEERYRELYQDAPVAYNSVGVDGLINNCNQRTAEITGYSIEELLGKPVFELYAETPEGKEKAARLFAQFLAGDPIQAEEVQLQRKDDTLVWGSLTVNAVKDINGKVIESRSTVTDITERKQAEAEVSAIDEISMIVTGTLDIDEVYEKFAQEVRKLVDFDRISVNVIDNEAEAFVFKYVSGVTYPGYNSGDLVPLAGTQTQQVVLTGQPLRRWDVLAEPGFVSDQTLIETGIRSTILVPLISQCSFIGVLALCSQQIGAYGPKEQAILERLASQIAPAIENAGLYEMTRSEKERATAALDQLQDSEESLSSLYSRSPVMMHTIDQEGRLISANKFWLQHLGYTHSEVIGRRSVEFLTEASQRHVYEVWFPEFFNTGFVRDVELQMVRKNGEVIDVLLYGLAERDASGEITMGHSFIIDVTQRKRTEERLRTINDQRRLEERLIEAQKLNAARQMAAGVAHNFNNALMEISLLARMIQQRPDDVEAVINESATIETAIQDASVMIRRLQAPESESTLTGDSININELVQATVELTRGKWQLATGEEGARIEINTQLAATLPLVGDPVALREVLTNLIFNSVDAMPEGGTITIKTDQREESLLLSISDTGVGMDQETKRRLFEPFFTTKEGGAGKGIGLFTVYHILTQHGAGIEVSSALNQGTTFTVRFPRVKSAE